MDEENQQQPPNELADNNEQFDFNMDEEQYGPQPMDQSFIPDTWIQSTEKNSRLYYGTPIYIDTVSGHTVKRPISRNAYELLKQFPFLKDYKHLMMLVELNQMIDGDDFEAFLVGQAISAKQIQEQVKSKEEMFANQVHAESSKETSARWREEMEKAQKKYAELQEYYNNIANNPQIVQDLVNTQNANTQLTLQNNQLQQQYDQLQQQNQILQQELNELSEYKRTIDDGSINALYNKYCVALDENNRSHQAEINRINISNTAAINGYVQQVFNLQSQVSSLQMQVNTLRAENKQKMDNFLARNKLRYISSSSDIADMKRELLNFIDGVLGIYDSAIDGVDNLKTAVNKTYTDVMNITKRTLDISPNFENVKFPKFKDAKTDAEKLKNKLENKYKVEEESVSNFIDKGKLPDLRDNGESSFSPY